MDNKQYIKNGFKGYYLKEGMKFGYWNILYKSNNKHKSHNAFWVCQCVCGKIKNVMARNLVIGISKSCGCIAIKNRRLEFGQSAKNRLYLKYKQQAKRRNIEFNLSLENFIKLTSRNCYYCNIEPSCFLGKRREDSLYGYYKYNGLDRKNNNLGYTENNSLPCCWNCNRMKAQMNQNDFLNHIKKIYNNLNYSQ